MIERRLSVRLLILLREAALLGATFFYAHKYLRDNPGIVSLLLWVAAFLLARWRFNTVIEERLTGRPEGER